jgi:hypothetical protein
MQNVTINIIELASELANMELENNWMDSIKVWVEDDDGDLAYTEEAQDIFNDLYDKYYSVIENTKINLQNNK